MTHLPDKIKTIADESEFRLKEKGSSFISISKPVQSEDESAAFLSSLKKKYYDATHHCYSYKLIDGKFKYSDDGEPNGTAGIRIYNAQNHFELTNLITVVIRYFGGVKLGVGPLGKAYYEASYRNLDESKIIEKNLYNEIEISYNFNDSKTVHHLISKHLLIIKQSLFEEQPKLICLIPSSSAKNFELDISNMNGSIVAIRTEKSEFF
jgi:uncharacterized YigZ family protein